MDERRGNQQTLSLTTAALTLVGVVLSIGLTIYFGVAGEWWLRSAAALLAMAALVGGVKLATRSGRGPLARFARWMISAPE
jgi:hypothetical protein